jgi:hypothetical protein
VGAYLVNEYQAFGIEAPSLHAPEYPQENSSRSAAPVDLFFGSCALALLPDKLSRFAHRNPRDGYQKLGSLGVGGPRPLLKVISEQLLGLLIELWSLLMGAFFAWRVPRSSSLLQ